MAVHSPAHPGKNIFIPATHWLMFLRLLRSLLSNREGACILQSFTGTARLKQQTTKTRKAPRVSALAEWMAGVLGESASSSLSSRRFFAIPIRKHIPGLQLFLASRHRADGKH
jgi:hypothetical protein